MLPYPPSYHTAPGLSKLSGLESLWLYNCRSIDPLLLAPLTKLQHLDLDSTSPAGGAKGAAVLLEVLPRLQNLTHLDLSECLCDAVSAPAAAFSALTASSKLEFLDIQYTEPPEGALACLLGRTLPQLQCLNLNGICSTCPDGLNERELRQLVKACPHLRSLQCSLQPNACPNALLQLTALTALTLDCVTVEVTECVLVKLTRLEELHIVPNSTIDDVGLLRLTALTQLSQLGIHHYGCTLYFEEEYRKLAQKDGEDEVLLFNAEVSRWCCASDCSQLDASCGLVGCGCCCCCCCDR